MPCVGMGGQIARPESSCHETRLRLLLSIPGGSAYYVFRCCGPVSRI
jgi:hypothetical protein